MGPKKGILERLAEGIVIGDGGYVWQLERRGYVKAGPWTPEVCVEHPEAVRQMHREFLRAGADVLQALTFYGTEDKLDSRGNKVAEKYTTNAINAAACKIANEVAAEGNALVLGSVSQTPSYMEGMPKEQVRQQFQKQVDAFDVDFLLCELFGSIEELETAIEVCKSTGKPVAANLCIGTEGDSHGVPTEECAVRMVKAGADIIGVNCNFDPMRSLDTIRVMKQGLEKAGLTTYLMCQPMGFHNPDSGKRGWIDLPEFPFALEARTCTRFDIHAYARKAFEMGVHYIGGCCGFEAYHVRAISEELAHETGRLPPGSEKHDVWAGALKMHTVSTVRERANRQYWENMEPASGRQVSNRCNCTRAATDN